MRYNKLLALISIAALTILVSCKDKDGPKIKSENEINTFVWKALNYWYYWLEDVPDLNDNRFSNESSRNEFLNGFSSPLDLFNSLKYSADRFSWIVDDYEALNNSFQGINKSFGHEFGLVYLESGSNQIIGYVQYVLSGSPADQAGLMRGDIFYAVNGTQLTDTNYSNLLFQQESYVLSLATLENSVLTPIGETPLMSAVVIQENPVLLAKTIDFEGYKVGYIVYNQFTHTFHSELNQAFASLKAAGAEHLVLDLRYNSGGSVYTAMHLAGMIYGQATDQTVFGRILYNEKQKRRNLTLPFLTRVDVLDGDFNTLRTENMSRLNVSKLYVLTTGATASASELIIAGLKSYMDVVLIGSKTVGKNEGSITLYDAPNDEYRDVLKANPNHKWAMQPIVTKLADSQNFADYSQGFSPDIALLEHQLLSFMKPLGDPEDIFLKTALEDIAGISSGSRITGVERKILMNKNPDKFPNMGMSMNGIQF